MPTCCFWRAGHAVSHGKKPPRRSAPPGTKSAMPSNRSSGWYWSIAKGHKYLTLVYQIDLGVTRLLWVGKERTIESFEGFFTAIGEEVTDSIRERYAVAEEIALAPAQTRRESEIRATLPPARSAPVQPQDRPSLPAQGSFSATLGLQLACVGREVPR